MEIARPLDTLNNARNKRVIVELKNGKQFIGNLKAFDIHINLVIETSDGMKFIRGDVIETITPCK